MKDDEGWPFRCPSGEEGQPGPPGEPEPETARHRGGRPRCAEETCSSLSIWIPLSAHDRIVRLANQRRQSVSGYMRDVLIEIFVRHS